MPNFFSTHKTAIVSAILSASLTGLVSFYIAYQNTNTNFQLTIKKEELNTLRLDLLLLNNVFSELTENANLLLKVQFQPEFDFKSSPLTLPAIQKLRKDIQQIRDKDLQATIKFMLDFVTHLFGDWESFSNITHVSIPKERFRNVAWRIPNRVTEIDFDLTQQLSELDTKIWQVNNSIDEIRKLVRSGRLVTNIDIEDINRQIGSIKDNLAAIKDNHLKIKDKVGSEIRRLTALKETYIQ
jgi:hypothetical protein